MGNLLDYLFKKNTYFIDKNEEKEQEEFEFNRALSVIKSFSEDGDAEEIKNIDTFLKWYDTTLDKISIVYDYCKDKEELLKDYKDQEERVNTFATNKIIEFLNDEYNFIKNEFKANKNNTNMFDYYFEKFCKYYEKYYCYEKLDQDLLNKTYYERIKDLCTEFKLNIDDVLLSSENDISKLHKSFMSEDQIKISALLKKVAHFEKFDDYITSPFKNESDSFKITTNLLKDYYDSYEKAVESFEQILELKENEDDLNFYKMKFNDFSEKRRILHTDDALNLMINYYFCNKKSCFFSKFDLKNIKTSQEYHELKRIYNDICHTFINTKGKYDIRTSIDNLESVAKKYLFSIPAFIRNYQLNRNQTFEDFNDVETELYINELREKNLCNLRPQELVDHFTDLFYVLDDSLIYGEILKFGNEEEMYLKSIKKFYKYFDMQNNCLANLCNFKKAGYLVTIDPEEELKKLTNYKKDNQLSSIINNNYKLISKMKNPTETYIGDILSFSDDSIKAAFDFYKNELNILIDRFEKKEIIEMYNNKVNALSCLYYSEEKFDIDIIETEEDDVLSINDIDLYNGIEFESFCFNLLEQNGFINIETTSTTGDQGVDIICEKDEIRYAIQCKCYTSDLGNTAVQEVSAGLKYYNCDIGVVMTNRHFTQGAKELAKANRIKLWDRDVLIKMLENYK